MGTPVALRASEKAPMYCGGVSFPGCPQLSIWHTWGKAAGQELAASGGTSPTSTRTIAPPPPPHLDQVDVVLREPIGVLLVVSPASCAVELAGALPCAGVEAEPEAPLMHIADQAVDPRGEALRVHLEVALCCARSCRPTCSTERQAFPPTISTKGDICLPSSPHSHPARSANNSEPSSH
jgi:hypothetical protein